MAFLSTLTAEQQIAAIYIGYYDRAADPVGSDFWEGAVANPNLSLADIATDFSTQAETQGVHPFFADPTAETANAFITTLYLNLFNREPDAAGLEFWSDALLAAINNEPGAISVGSIILEIIEGAQNTPEGNDLTTILNKIEVSNAWTDAAESAGIDYTSDTGAQASAKSIIEGVTDVGSTVTSAKSTIADFFEPTGVEGVTKTFTSGTDDLFGTDDNDTFEGYLQQNPFAGGVSNGLSSADRADGGAGKDKLYAELVSEFVGGVSGTENIDVQPRIKNIETLEFEARDIAQNAPFNIDIQDLLGDLGFGITEGAVAGFLDGWQRDIVIDAKNITGHDFLGSTFSDGDLMIENVNTLTSGGAVRNTSDITIGMNHTDNANSDGDASDLTVYFDEDYLISGQAAEGKVFYFLLDEEAERLGNPNRLNNIDVDGIRFTITRADGTVEDVNIEADAANTAGTHQGFVNALQAPLQALIADGTLPAGTTLTLDPTVTDFTFLDDGTQSADIPAIVLTSGDGSVVTATGFSRIQEEIGEYDVYGRFNSINEVENQPVSINIDLFKAGRGGEGGNLVIGGKDQSEIGNGIEVFHVNVKGDGPDATVNQPSNIGTLTSTNNALREIYISTDPMDAVKSSFASLTIRDGFNELYDGDSFFGQESGDLQLVNADGFLGNLSLGTDEQIINLDTLTAQGGGDVFFNAELDGTETNQAYSYTTGGGNDTILVEIDGDATDFAGSSLNVMTGGGDDEVEIDFNFEFENNSNQTLNQNILDNVNVETGDGADTINLDGFGGKADVDAGAGNDVIYSDQGDEAEWFFNFDNLRVDAQGGLGNINDANMPGVQTSLAYLGGAVVTVTLSGAGIAALTTGGGVMSLLAPGAIQGDDGYEARATIASLTNGNTHYGDQRDVNKAIADAINNDAVLSKLLAASVTSNNVLKIETLTGGTFDPLDLRVDINTRDADSTSYATSVLTEARSVFGNSALTLTNLWGTTVFTPTAADYQATAPGADLTTSATANTWYDGLSVRGDANSADDNQQTSGSADANEHDHTLNGGAGNDVIVLSTDATGSTPTARTVSTENALINGASNETVVMNGANFGNDTVMNFTTGGATTFAATLTAAAPATDPNAGLDFLDFTAYLVSEEDNSVNTASEPDSNVSHEPIPVTLDFDLTAVDANEVSVVTFTGTATQTWGGLTASVLQAAFNNTAATSDFGSIVAAATTANDEYAEPANGTDPLVAGNAHSVVMIENANNLGEYKVFEVVWNGDASADVDGAANGVVTVTQRGELDFGTTLTDLQEVNLVGSDAYDALLQFGFV